MTILPRSIVVVAFVIAAAASAAAQGSGAAAAPGDLASATYRSPMRAQCGEELRKDLDWQANILSVCEAGAHEKAAAKIQRNERHVFIAYGVIWVLVAGLVGLMWLRQGKLNAEIQRLEEELRRAEQDGK